MSLYDRIREDSRVILNEGFTAEFTLDNGLTGESRKTQPINGSYADTGLVIDMTTGLPAAGQKTVIVLHVDDVTISSGPNETFSKFCVTWTNVTGQTRTGKFYKPMVDRTFGIITTTLEL